MYLCFGFIYLCCILLSSNNTGVISDPLGQTHSHASSEHCFLLFCFVRFWKVGTDGRTKIPTGRDFGLAVWINRTFFREWSKQLYIQRIFFIVLPLIQIYLAFKDPWKNYICIFGFSALNVSDPTFIDPPGPTVIGDH